MFGHASMFFRSAIGSGTSVSDTRRTSSKLKKRPTCTLPKPPRPPQAVAAQGAPPPPGAGLLSPAEAAVVVAAVPAAATGAVGTLEGFRPQNPWLLFITNCFTFLFKYSNEIRSEDSAVFPFSMPRKLAPLIIMPLLVMVPSLNKL